MDAVATAAATQAPPAKRGRGRPRKQAATTGSGNSSSSSSSGGGGVASSQSSAESAGDPTPQRQSPMEAMPFLDRALGVLDMGEAAQRAEARVRPHSSRCFIDISFLMPLEKNKRRGSLMLIAERERGRMLIASAPWCSSACRLAVVPVAPGLAWDQCCGYDQHLAGCCSARWEQVHVVGSTMLVTKPATCSCAAARGRGQLAVGGSSRLGGWGRRQGLAAGRAAAAGRVCSRF